MADAEDKKEEATPATDSKTDLSSGSGADAKLELSAREIAIARGENPDKTIEAPAASSESGEKDDATSDGVADGGGEQASGAEQGTQDAAGDSPADEGGKDAAAWLTDDVREIAKRYSLDDNALAGMSGVNELFRTMALLDKRSASASSAGKDAGKVDAAAATAATDSKTDPTKGADAQDVPDLDPQKYVDGGYDEATVALVKYAKGLRDQVDSMKGSVAKVSELESQIRNQQVQAFHDLADGMDEGRFGRTLKDGKPMDVPAAQDANRRKLFEAMNQLAAGEAATGGRTSSMATLAKKAEAMVFSQEIREQERKALQKRLSDQSRQRRSSAARASNVSASAGRSGPQTAADIVNSPRLIAAFTKYQEENGSR